MAAMSTGVACREYQIVWLLSTIEHVVEGRPSAVDTYADSDDVACLDMESGGRLNCRLRSEGRGEREKLWGRVG